MKDFEQIIGIEEALFIPIKLYQKISSFFYALYVFLKTLTRINLFHVHFNYGKNREFRKFNPSRSIRILRWSKDPFKRRRGQKTQTETKLDCHQTIKEFL